MKLATYLSEHDLTETAFAQSLGVAQVTINRYVRNDRFPDPETIERIAKATKQAVTVTDWYEQAAEHRAAKAGEAA